MGNELGARMYFRLPKSLAAKIKHVAEAEDKSVAYLVRLAVVEYLVRSKAAQASAMAKVPPPKRKPAPPPPPPTADELAAQAEAQAEAEAEAFMAELKLPSISVTDYNNAVRAGAVHWERPHPSWGIRYPVVKGRMVLVKGAAMDDPRFYKP